MKHYQPPFDFEDLLRPIAILMWIVGTALVVVAYVEGFLWLLEP